MLEGCITEARCGFAASRRVANINVAYQTSALIAPTAREADFFSKCLSNIERAKSVYPRITFASGGSDFLLLPLNEPRPSRQSERGPLLRSLTLAPLRS